MESTITAEPTGQAAGRVTIVTTLASLLPPVVATVIVAVCFTLGILDAGISAGLIIGILGTGIFTTGTVFKTAQKTPTDQVRMQTVLKEVEVPVVAPTAGYDVGMMPDVQPTVEVDDLAEAKGSHVADASAETLRAELAAR